jgi:hypothetical protein
MAFRSMGGSGTVSRALYRDLNARKAVKPARSVKGSRFHTQMSPRNAFYRRLANRTPLHFALARGLKRKTVTVSQTKGILRGQGFGARGTRNWRRDAHGRFA